MSIAHRDELKHIPEAILAETAAWMSRLHSAERDPRIEAGFRRWLEADARHARAFESMTDIWNTVSGLPSGRLTRVGHGGRSTLGRRGFGRRWAIAVASFVVVALGLTAYWSSRSPAYATDIGRQRVVELRDGSRVTLNSNTRVSVAFTSMAREIHLQKGEALFDVHADAERPFTVIAGDRRVTALGTSFIVRYDAQQTAVTLMQGKVEIVEAGVAAIAQAPARKVVLAPGERFTVMAQSTQAVDRPKIDAVAAWRRGEIVFDHTPLAAAVAEMNRYETTPIVIDVPEAAGLQISGNYKTGDGQGFAESIAGLYGLEVRQSEGFIRIGRGHSSP